MAFADPGRFAGYDLIGDVHGCADSLCRLLERLGYRQERGVYAHPSRQAVFVGDIVDRGPKIREALHLVRAMVDRGHAQMVMGNHEYNVLAYFTPLDHEPEQYLRPHIARHRRLIAQTQAQFADHTGELASFLDWFSHLPLFLEFRDFRVVHACWDEALIRRFQQHSGGNRLTASMLQTSANHRSFEARVLKRLTRGLDLRMPEGFSITGGDGLVRRAFRVGFWQRNPKTYQDVLFQPDPLPEALAARPLSDSEQRRLLCYGEQEPPLFFGHYWRTGAPELIRHNLACLDYSAVKGGHLVAYRMDGEQRLDPQKFVTVEVTADEILTEEWG